MATDTLTLDQEVTALLRGKRLEDPWPIWARLREEAPVALIDDAVIFSTYDDVRSMLNDAARFSSKFYITGSRADRIVSQLTDEGKALWREMSAFDGEIMTRTDGERHERLRRIAHRYFTPRRIRELSEAVQEFMDELVEQAAQQEVYDHKWLVQDLALRVMTHVIGAPQVDRDLVASYSAPIARWLGTTEEDVIRDARAARQRFNAYIEETIIAAHRRNPGSNELVEAMMEATDDDNLSPTELVAMVHVLLFGGLETTAVLLSSGLVELLQHRDQWELVCSDPDRWVGPAVEELLRYVAPAQWTNRVAAVDIDWHDGFHIATGQTVIGAVAPANRDPGTFERPDTLDITRGTKSHLGLGIGPHYCLGASLIREEARIAFDTLARRYPDLELAIDPADLDWSGSNPILRAVRELPVRLGPPRSSS
jgi:cytochrome P450